MKLPTDTKERMKVLILVGAGTLASLYGVFQGLSTLGRTKVAFGEKLVDIEWQTTVARHDVQSAESSRRRNTETLERIVEISHKHLLHPILGNYRLGASEILDRYAERLGVAFTAVQEVGITDLPKPPDRKMNNILKAYTVRVTMECSYRTLIEFLAAIEADNPTLVVSEVAVTGQADKDPEKHNCVVGIQWPIWAETEMAVGMEERLKSLQPSVATSTEEQEEASKE